jgi:hypothetical protein
MTFDKVDEQQAHPYVHAMIVVGKQQSSCYHGSSKQKQPHSSWRKQTCLLFGAGGVQP